MMLKTNIFVSMIRQKALGNVEQAEQFWKEQIGVDNVITRKFLSWDDNTSIDLSESIDSLYAEKFDEIKLSEISPCVWLFERLNIDTLGQFALCGQDISFRTADKFPTLYEATIESVWHSEVFQK